MCNVCGCGHDEHRIEGKPMPHGHDSVVHDHGPGGHHHHHHPAEGSHDLHFGTGPAGVDVAGHSQSRLIQIEQDILGKNDAYAAMNRTRLDGQGVLAVNLMSSPGAGKTTLLETTLTRLGDCVAMAVIEGDQETANDADRIRRTGVPAIQINTGRGCHLDAHMVGHALDQVALSDGGLLFIENVGNLVCPAAFDLGETCKVAILSVTEGDDKPIKYPDMFAAADLMLLSKTDLLPHVDFDVARCIDHARHVNPAIEAIQVSARTGDGLDAWIDWLTGHLGGGAAATTQESSDA